MWHAMAARAEAAPEAVAAILSRLDILASLPQERLHDLALQSRTIGVRRGAMLFVTGDPAALYVITAGEVEMLVQTRAGIIEVGSCAPGDFCGEASLFLGVQISGARALELTAALRIDDALLLTHLQSSPTAMFALATRLARQLADA